MSVLSRGHLSVGDGHQIYYEDWGNPTASPIFHLHGGPGSNFSESHKALYDPTIHRVIFHDQRGCGQSTPFASTQHNTTQHLIADMEQLRQHFGLDTIAIAGGSWGSTLALLYALAHPQRVTGLLLWSIYLAREFEDNWMPEGYPRHHFPLEWRRFIKPVPTASRRHGAAVTKWYYEAMRQPNQAQARHYAYEWALWESCLMSLSYDPATLQAELAADPATLAVALLETHYFLNHCFIPQNYILDNLPRITHIPAYIVHGRFDMCTPASTAADLADAYGPQATLKWVNSGHLRSEPAMLQTLQEIVRHGILKP